MIERCLVLPYGGACISTLTFLVPLRSWDRTLLVGVRHYQARIDCKFFAADKAGGNTHLDHMLEDAAENIAVAEPLVAGARKGTMVWKLVFNAQSAQPTIGKIHLHLAAERSFRAYREHIANDEHPDHQDRIDRGPAHR